MIWFGWVLWHINHCRLFNAKSSLYIYIKYIWFGLVGFYGISTIVGYLMLNPVHTYILNIHNLVWVGFYGISTIVGYLMPNPVHIYIYIKYTQYGLSWVLWHINHCRLFNVKSFLYVYIKHIWFRLVRSCGISTSVGYLMPNTHYTFILNIWSKNTFCW